MANATDNPNNLTAMLYSGVDVLAPRPKSYLVTLDGTANPSTAAVYTYTSGSNFLLSPSTWYFIVLTAGTSVADGAYNWSYGSRFGYVRSGGWLNDSGIYQSSDGSSWTLAGGSDWDAQFAITATAIPEPSMCVAVFARQRNALLSSPYYQSLIPAKYCATASRRHFTGRVVKPLRRS